MVLATCGVYAAVTMAPIVAYEVTGSVSRGPAGGSVSGGGRLGASRVTALIARYGHQKAFAAVDLLGAGACLVAVAAVVTANFALLIVGVGGIGVGHAVNQLARYAAAELHAEQRRLAVIVWLVWAQAIGAVLGPLSLSPAGRASSAFALPVEAGGFLVGLGCSPLLRPRMGLPLVTAPLNSLAPTWRSYLARLGRPGVWNFTRGTYGFETSGGTWVWGRPLTRTGAVSLPSTLGQTSPNYNKILTSDISILSSPTALTPASSRRAAMSTDLQRL